MARLIHQIGLSLSSDAADIRPAFTRSFDEPSLKVLTDRFSDFVVGSLTLPADGRTVSIPLGALADARGYYVELYGGGALLCLNAETPPQTLDPAAPGTLQLRSVGSDASGVPLPLHSYQDVQVRSLCLGSTDAQTVTGAYAIWGFAETPA